jgi:hypothetical protein
MILWLPSAPLLLLAVWDGVDGQEGQREREIPAQVRGQSHEIKRSLCNLLEFTPGQVKGQSHEIKRVLCNLLEFTPGQVKGQSHGIKRGLCNLLKLETPPDF